MSILTLLEPEIKAMRAGNHIFLSYRSLERSFALKLAAALLNNGVKVWVDCLPGGIGAGDDWPQALQEALRSCSSLIAAVSPDYVTSSDCLKELSLASQLDRPIFPVQLTFVPTENTPYELVRLQYVDFTRWQDPEEFQKAIDILLPRLRSRAGEVIGQIPDPEKQHLIHLIADLESKGGVCRYVELIADLLSREHEDSERLKRITVSSQWGLDQEFQLLDYPSDQEKRIPRQEVTSKPIGNILEIIRTPGRYMLLGEPGSGKTTTLRRLALECARLRLKDDRNYPLPLFLSLPQWVSEPDPLTFIRSWWPLPGKPDEAIASGEVILFLDGLNELGEYREQKAEKLREWMESPNAPKFLIVTCRTHDYAGKLKLGVDFVITLQNMDDRRISKFAEVYLQDAAGKFLDQIMPAGELSKEKPRTLRSLARNPYLLTCLMVLFERSPAKSLPLNSGLLFLALSKFLWHRELNRQTLGWKPYEFAERVLGGIAFNMIDGNLPTSVPESYLEEQLKESGSDKDIISVALSSTLMERDGTSYRFAHQLIQEYFAATRLMKGGAKNYIRAQEFEGPDRFSPWRSGPIAGRWDEVVIAACGISLGPEKLLSEVADINIYLAARGALTLDKINPEFIQKIKTELAEIRRNQETRLQNLLKSEPGIFESSGQAHDAWEASYNHQEGIRDYAKILLDKLSVIT